MLQPQQHRSMTIMATLYPNTVTAGDKTNTQDLEMHGKPSENHYAPKNLAD